MRAKRRSLAQRRRAVGHTQEQLAELLEVERSTVVRWEAGETEPQPCCRPKLAETLGVSLDELHELLATPDELPAAPSDKLILSMGDFSSAQIGTLMKRFAAMDIGSRRDVLQELTIMSGTILLQPVRRWVAQSLAAVPLISPESINSDALDALERALTVFRRWDNSGLGGLHRKAVVGQLNAVAETLHEAHSPTVRQRLFQIMAELAQMAGWMAFDQGLPGVAQRYYLLGLSACREARSPVLGAKILGDMARLSGKYAHYEDSLDLVHTALYSLPHHDSALVRAELLGLESVAHAHLGGPAQVTRASDACVEVWRGAQADVAPDWHHYMGQAQVDGLAADAYIELALRTEDRGRAIAHAERAEQHTLSARESRAPGFNRSRIFDEIRLANVRLAQHDVAESVTVAQAALELATPMSSTWVCDRLLGFHGGLSARYPDNVHVIPFREQLHEYVTRVTPGQERDITVT